MSGVTGCSGTPLPLLSFPEVPIKGGKREKKGEKMKKKGRKARQHVALLVNKLNYCVCVGVSGNLSSSISGIILGGMGTSTKESTFAFKSCIQSIFGIEVP